jgi:hypothetical protein
MARRYRRVDKVIAWYRGIPHVLDLRACRQAFVRSEMVGHFDSVEALAEAVNISRSTGSRFFNGRPVSLDITMRLVSALGLRLEEVVWPASPEEVAMLDGELGDVA